MNATREIARSLLLQVLRSPAAVLGFDARQWEELLCHARSTRLSGRIWFLLEQGGLADRIPPPARRRLSSAFLEAEHHRRQLFWEIDRIHRALRGAGFSFVVLKGGGYAAAGLRAAKGRPAADIDIMVPADAIAEAEKIFLKHGWDHVIEDSYDQRYYRHWMHELPPLRHRVRETELDIHRAIVPLSSRLRTNSESLFRMAVVLDERGTRVFSPPDMVLHCAVHLFHDGEIRGGLRDLVDIDALLREFGERPGFWATLMPRTIELGLQRPLFYAFRHATRLLGTPVPPEVLADALAGRPPAPVLVFMDLAIPRALIPPSSRGEAITSSLYGFFLYVRSHWLRMSFGPLSKHLARKSLRRFWPGEDRVRDVVR
jgi:hypothetical protein